MQSGDCKILLKYIRFSILLIFIQVIITNSGGDASSFCGSRICGIEFLPIHRDVGYSTGCSDGTLRSFE